MHFFLSMAVKKPLLPKKTVPFFVTHRIIQRRLIELGGQLKYQSVQYKNHSKVYSVNVEGCKYLQTVFIYHPGVPHSVISFSL